MTTSFGVPNDLVRFLSGFICGFFVIVVGILAILEYLMAYMEFMLVSGVGIILFPLSLWEGSKFMAEKLIGAIIGFFIKLLFCNIVIFLVIYGFMSLAAGYTENSFTGAIEQVVIVVFVGLLFFFLSKSVPGLAQSLLTGAPSLSAAGAIGAAAGAIGAGAAVAGMATGGASMVASGAAKAAFGATGALTQAAGAAGGAGASGGSKAGAFISSLGASAKETAKSFGGDLTRSLLGGGGAGTNRHSQRQKFLGETNPDGTKKSFGEYLQGRKEEGSSLGRYHTWKENRQQTQDSEDFEKLGAIGMGMRRLRR